jgi:diaminopimelate epimerase
MSGCGNDFIIIDNRNNIIDKTDLTGFVKKVCKRKMSVGSDGLILIENSETNDFRWRFFNSDGSVAEMCGNGARCAARFAYINNIAPKDMSFETDAGVIKASVSDNLVKIKMTDPYDITEEFTLALKDGYAAMNSVNTGVPHVVIHATDIDKIDVAKIGRELRFHQYFKPAGTNVNFLYARSDGALVVRTYERGVEGETLACGTGVVASAIINSNKTTNKSPIKVITKSGGILNVYFNKDNNKFSDVFLEGDARIIYEGKLNKEALEYDADNVG